MNIEIDFRNEYPSKMLSNLYPHPFKFDNKMIGSMEGLLQGFKFENVEEQNQILTLSGFKAKQAGKHKEWWSDQNLWWDGIKISRHSYDYQILLDVAYKCLFTQNKEARKALFDTKNKTLKHSIGGTDPTRTILTRQEFCSRLTRIRNDLQSESFLEFE
jgi:predicted NAD-dependent protein-ADP-ribosyltransferase YbiA (DUF1768 family)